MQPQAKGDSWSGQKPGNDPKSLNAGNPDNPDAPKGNSNRVEHQAIAEAEPFSESGRDIGLVKAPIVSLNPSSGNEADAEPKHYDLFGDANRYLNHVGPKHDFAFPFEDMDIGQGFFVPVERNSNIDKLIAHLYSAVDAFHKQTSVTEKDHNGDDVLETVTTLPKKRNQDGTIQLDGMSNPIVGANHANRPKQIRVAEFIIKSAVKDDDIAKGKKAESDGALVIRVA